MQALPPQVSLWPLLERKQGVIKSSVNLQETPFAPFIHASIWSGGQLRVLDNLKESVINRTSKMIDCLFSC
jgi:hypothetical protein